MAQAAEARRLIAYFRECLLEENRDRESMDVFGRGEREQVLRPLASQLSGDTLSLSDLGLSRSAVAQLNKLERLHQQDYQLMLGLYPVAMQLCNDEGSQRRIRVPALSVPLSLADVAAGNTSVLCRIQDLEVHPALRDTLRLERVLTTRTGSLPDAVETALSALSRPVACPDDRSRYPLPRHEDQLTWGRACIIWLSRRSLMGRSVLHELDRLSGGNEPLSSPLHQILQDNPRQSWPAPMKISRPKVEAWLTDAQLEAVVNGQSFPLSVINGPPGTGKTHTLAALVLDAVLRNQSILVVCSNDHAADVVQDKIGAMLGTAANQILRPGRGSYRRTFLEQLDQWLSGERRVPDKLVSPGAARRAFIRSRRVTRHCERQWRRTVALEQHATASSGLVKGFARWRLTRADPVSFRWQSLTDAQAEESEQLDRWLQTQLDHRMTTLLGQHRQALAALNTALRSRAARHRNRRFEALDWPLLTRVFPVWVVSAGALSEVVPLQRELFDLVVIDEATQCNLPQALPALQRGKRAVVVGDPRQLRHFSFVSHSFQQRTAGHYGLGSSSMNLDYRSHSLLDYALDALPSPDATTFLDEHFRSRPELISFCNDTFYGGRLKLVTALRPAPAEPTLQIHECAFSASGEHNPEEASQVMAVLHELISRHGNSTRPPSIGVLAMLRGMATDLEKRILNEVSLSDIGRFQLRVGTPYGFQGEERDIMIIAACARPGQSAAARRYLDRPDVFNVAMTRARNHLHLVCTSGAMDEAPNSLLARYLADASAAEADTLTTPLAQSGGAPGELTQRLQGRGIETFGSVPFGGHQLGLVARSGDTVLCIDTPDQRTLKALNPAARPARAYRQLLRRAGVKLFFVSAVQWHQHGRSIAIENHCGKQLGLATSPATDSGMEDARSHRVHDMSRRVRQLDTSDLDSVADLSELHRKLLQAKAQVMLWLDRHFDRSELTWQRYHSAANQLYNQALNSLDGACMVIESYHDLGNPEALLSAVEQKVASCEKAVDALIRLATELATLGTGNRQIDEATADLEHLIERVERYRVPD